MSRRFISNQDHYESPEEVHRRIRRKVRRRPAWWLRRWERRIVARPRPSAAELVELGAIRTMLRIRAGRGGSS